jgi:hypothetical protein
MITFKDLGNLGRFGNQIFQIAATIGAAEKHGYSYGFPEWSYQKYFKNPLPKGGIWPEGNYYEPNFHYNEINILDNTNLSGFFQSEKYFKHCQEKIRHYFEFEQDLVEKIKDRFSYILKEEICAIHVRRGDYVTNPNHLALPYEYYIRAIKHIPNGVKLLVFTDDIPYCNKIFSDGFHIIENNSDIEDFILMSLCNHFIIANSSFSWWAAWLSKGSGKRIAPHKWFGPGLKHHSTKDLIPDNWIIV